MPDRPATEEAVAAFRLDGFLPYRLSVAANRVSKAFARRYAEEFGLTIPEWRVLAVLGSYAPCSSNEIVERTAMDKAKVSRAVARLTASGHLKRTTNPADQRLIELAFTRRGRNVYEAIVPRARAIEAELLAGMPEADRRTLDRVLSHLARRLDRLEQEDGAGTLPSAD